MAVTQYIGARYVPVFADPTEWSSARTYEPLTIVLHEGNSYTSRQAVPVGIDIMNDAFWAETGNYNGQVEAYRKEVLAFSSKIADTAEAVKTEKTRAEAAEKDNADSISAEKTRAEAAEKNLGDRIDNIKVAAKRGIVIFGDSWTTYHNKVFMNTLAAQPNIEFCKCYGVSGARVGDLPAQVTSAKADTTLDIYSVTDVFVVVGTNNVYWNTAITAEDSYAAFLTITQSFPYAKLHWFPNNSKTNNDYHNAYYTIIGTGAAKAGFTTHYESLCVPFAYNTTKYPSLDLPGYQDNQHLTEDCSKYFIMQCLNLANGGSAQSFNLRLSYDTTENSCWTGSNMNNAYYHGNYHEGVIELKFDASEMAVNPGSSTEHFYAYSKNSPLQWMSGGNYNHGSAQLGASTIVALANKKITDGGLGLQVPIPDKTNVQNLSAYIHITEGFI